MKTKNEKMIKILVVDDHHLVRNGSKLLFSKNRSMQIIGMAHDGLEAVQKSRELNPDVILMDVEMPHLNGIEATRKIVQEFPHIKVLMISGHPNPLYVKNALEAGARGYITKDTPLRELIHAIKTIMKDKTYLWERLPPTEQNITFGFETFTEREKEILKLISLGKKNKYIAEKLYISIPTLRVHKLNMRKKVKAKSDIEMLMLALKYHFLSLDGFNVKH